MGPSRPLIFIPCYHGSFVLKLPRDQSLQVGEGGATNGICGKFYPYKKGTETVLAMLKGAGCTTSFEVVLTQVLKVLAMLKGGGGTKFPPSKKVQQVLSCLEGGGAQKNSNLVFFQFCSPPFL